jgi:hypothetical protein
MDAQAMRKVDDQRDVREAYDAGRRLGPSAPEKAFRKLQNGGFQAHTMDAQAMHKADDQAFCDAVFHRG